ncbi:aminodeoxychorismate synthase component I [Parashewanella spongiae]|nr:aminodeoxychorismate synthase component I [Parashewanella spongiae]MCL1078433.1 aminodeoxychorismate synthase component I [Parashewanella spongiae]
MSNPLAVRKIDINLTTTEIFSFFANKPWAVLLDSADANHPDASYDIIAFDPIATLCTDGQLTTYTPINPLRCQSKTKVTRAEQPFTLLQEYLNILYPEKKQSSLPFSGGVIGSFSYDLGRHIESISPLSLRDINLPEMNVGFYDWSLIYCYEQNEWFLVHTQGESALKKTLEYLYTGLSVQQAPRSQFNLSTPWNTQITKNDYTSKFNTIQDYLQSGDCYQINLTQRFCADYFGCEWNAYLKLRAENKAPFSAFMKLEQHSILSISPERFIQLDGKNIQTKPIKGTLPRESNQALDIQAAKTLQSSIKDRAENLMITDLLRNDLGKVAQAGTVIVPKLFDIESFPAVHHLVSTITACLKPELDATDILLATFPGGSITGAPKIRAMQIIEELEPSRRSIYCGSIGYISQDGKMDTSITIRTLVTEANKIYCWAGGGIVADSKVEAEYQESFDKVSRILPILSQ